MDALGRTCRFPDEPAPKSLRDDNSEQAQRARSMLLLYNQKSEVFQKTIWCWDDEEKKVLKEKYDDIRSKYKCMKKTNLDALYSLTSLFGQDVYDRAPLISEKKFRCTLWCDPEKTPLGTLDSQTVEELKKLFPPGQPILRVENGNGQEFVMFSAHDDHCETVFAFYEPLMTRKLKVLAIESDGEYNEIHKKPMSFFGVLQVMLIIHDGAAYEMMNQDETAFLGFSAEESSDEEDHGSD